MLIRIRGGNDGIKTYLENGQMDGRQFTRDELDERVVLAGDLALCDAVIQSIASKGNRYDHITLAFKEDLIETSALRLITNEFRQFAFAAHGDDEYSFYAEAHNPKIKSYADLATGKLVERKPHIHIVIPSRNLLTGQSLRYFGQVKTIEAFIDAFQEHVNRKYGFASPKDHRRLKITDASEMISRYKGDDFKGANRQLKEQLLNAMVDHDIVTFTGFHELLNRHGAVVVRKGRDGDYLNVTPPTAKKGINLKESVFSREFIELPTPEKLQRLNETSPLRYESGPTDAAATRLSKQSSPSGTIPRPARSSICTPQAKSTNRNTNPLIGRPAARFSPAKKRHLITNIDRKIMSDPTLEHLLPVLERISAQQNAISGQLAQALALLVALNTPEDSSLLDQLSVLLQPVSRDMTGIK